MRASKWVVQKIIQLLNEEEPDKNFEEIKRIFARYPDDMTFSKIGKDFEEYAKKPTRNKFNAISKKLGDALKTRKFEASGGTGLWFGDRRKTRNSQTTR